MFVRYNFKDGNQYTVNLGVAFEKIFADNTDTVNVVNAFKNGLVNNQKLHLSSKKDDGTITTMIKEHSDLFSLELIFEDVEDDGDNYINMPADGAIYSNEGHNMITGKRTITLKSGKSYRLPFAIDDNGDSVEEQIKKVLEYHQQGYDNNDDFEIGTTDSVELVWKGKMRDIEKIEIVLDDTENGNGTDGSNVISVKEDFKFTIESYDTTKKYYGVNFADKEKQEV